MTAREKVLNIERQVRAIAAGEAEAFDCPFCGLSSSPKEGALCCFEAAEIVEAVLNHIDFKEAMQMADRVMDRFVGMTSGGIVH